jgi:hypothetical protein
MDNFFSSLDPPMVRTADFANGRLIRVISLCSCRNCLNHSLMVCHMLLYLASNLFFIKSVAGGKGAW